MQNMVQKLLLILIILALCGWALIGKDWRLGKDLRGGVSLVYAVQIAEEDSGQADELIRNVIDVLKDRINPAGVLDISIEPLGNDRIEIVMPLPSDEVKELQDAYKQALDELVKFATIRPASLDAALQAGDAVVQLNAEPGSDRAANLQAAQDAYNTMTMARAAFDEAAADSETPETQVQMLARAVADADDDFDLARNVVLNMSLPEARLHRMLRLSDQPEKEVDDDGNPIKDENGEYVYKKDPRLRAADDLRQEYPGLKEGIDGLIAEFDVYEDKRKGFDDPADLKRLLQGAGVLEFRIAVRPNATDIGLDIPGLRDELREVGPQNTTSTVAKWVAINEVSQFADTPALQRQAETAPALYFSTYGGGLVVEEHDGELYMLLYDLPTKKLTHEGNSKWSIKRAFNTADMLGRPAIGFQLDPTGGNFMGKMTAQNVGEPMAITLDNRVYTAPRLNSTIASNGQITGSFSTDDLNYLIRTLSAGALEAQLSQDPIAENTLGPSLGENNLDKGREGFILAIIVVALFMLGYYFFAGIVANLALLINGIIILGFMKAIDGTFTLPGLAGIVLTIGMAVDANVLIYERIREELFEDDSDLRGAIRLGYGKAMSTIFDANITNLIVCFVLAKTATTEVKGFALTLAIGICATLFTALFVTRQFYYLYTDVFGARSLTMLPTKIPAIHRMLEPSVNWMRLRPMFWVASAAAVILSLVLVAGRGVDMLDTELRGGVSATLNTKRVESDDTARDAARVPLSLDDVLVRVNETIPASTESLNLDGFDQSVIDAVRAEFSNASVLTVGETTSGADGEVMTTTIQVKVASPKDIGENIDIAPVVVACIEQEFANDMDITPALDFVGADSDNPTPYTAHIERGDIASVIGDGPSGVDLTPYIGGTAFEIRGVSPPTTIDDLTQRLSRMRSQPDFLDLMGREVLVTGINSAGDGIYSDFLISVHDSNMMHSGQDPEAYYSRMDKAEWDLIRIALGQQTSLEQVTTFSSAVAATLKAKATVAVILSLLGILIYIWLRFGSLRYSIAAIVALSHDVIIALGLLALSAIIGGDGGIGSFLLIEEFRIDLGVVAALLTIIGYSLNDTIVILDRVRENRGKRPVATASIVNSSINQCFSRTVLTSVTTLIAVLIMYFEGGSGIRPFTFCLLTGLVVGTYSSVAIASPLVVGAREPVREETKVDPATGSVTA